MRITEYVIPTVIICNELKSDAIISVVDDHVDVTNDIFIDNDLADISTADDNLFDVDNRKETNDSIEKRMISTTDEEEEYIMVDESVEMPEEIVCNATNIDVNSVVYIPPPSVVATTVKTEPEKKNCPL